jgi:hypothetical protein
MSTAIRLAAVLALALLLRRSTTQVESAGKAR